ncbi:Rossmann-fold NAD(P)-binding domain-containing protein [Agromyces marinus]|uniref:NAD(P)-binding domain-containing protein n=1 Tax=Agromyces marinus TaxID=1389020 RepID=A0ABM8H115_9MICO|nr:hypothetical protein [Agromyces marinus]UIP57427.1 hypothetical protein DSM26151_02820 [Agromyces marinus]BDZ54450.1 hypothetical protein GCM10025870_15230 [Agromyces marinus]
MGASAQQVRPSILVIGASGVLAPAVEALRLDARVTGISLTRPAPDGVESILVNASDPVALGSALAGRSWSAAVVYAPAVTRDTLAIIAAASSRRAVVVRTSDAVDPAHGAVDVPADTLQLGWAVEPDGRRRWHSAEEISAAALEVLSDGVGRVLGAIRPWEERP